MHALPYSGYASKTPTKERQTQRRFVDSGTYTAASSTIIDRSGLEALVVKHDAVSPPRQSSPNNASATVHRCDFCNRSPAQTLTVRQSSQSINAAILSHGIGALGPQNPAVWRCRWRPCKNWGCEDGKVRRDAIGPVDVPAANYCAPLPEYRTRFQGHLGECVWAEWFGGALPIRSPFRRLRPSARPNGTPQSPTVSMLPAYRCVSSWMNASTHHRARIESSPCGIRITRLFPSNHAGQPRYPTPPPFRFPPPAGSVRGQFVRSRASQSIC